jgi:hypothetical protein
MVLMRASVGDYERTGPTRLILSPMGSGRIAVGCDQVALARIVYNTRADVESLSSAPPCSSVSIPSTTAVKPSPLICRP